MPVWLTWLVALGVLVLESALLSVLGMDGFIMQTAIVLTMFLGLRRDFVAGAIVLAALLVPIEWLVVGPMGYYSLGLVVLFFVFQLTRDHVDSEWGLSQILLAVFAVLLHTAVVGLSILFLEADSRLAQSVGWAAPAGVLGAALTVWPLGLLMSRLDRMLDPRSGRAMGLSSVNSD